MILIKYNVTTRNNAEGGSTNCLMESLKSFQNFQMERQELFKHNKIKWGYERRWSRKWNVKRKHGE